ncbi:hypothetical protein PVK06_020782 [Gossypium arboreum]|uniref:RNase H type-1 domain-containing protein n=1 Tax=Gossypium arboreum TaxID=29729 RepID=A0ABR0PNA6_GOSAR|nr:hypothetical protein PVK06_020782 [Gossypium arboreum]
MTMTNTTLFYAPSIPSTCIYLNIDGAIQTNIGLSIVGGMIRDETRKWILGYNRFLVKSSVFIVELWGILDGLLLLQKQGHDTILILLDNLEVVKVICNRNANTSSISLVKGIQDILFQEKRWILRHIRREDNQVADTLGKMAFANKEELCLFEDSQLVIQETVEEDIARGSLFPSSTL